jgi:hypothetical protein
MDAFSPALLRLSSDQVQRFRAQVETRAAQTRRRKQLPVLLPARGEDGRFVRGPLSLHWWMHTVKLGGVCSAMAVWLHHLAGLRSCRRDGAVVVSCRAAARHFDVDPRSLQRALDRLARAGYIAITKKRGGNSLVRFVTIPPSCPCRLCTRTARTTHRTGEA